MTTEKNAALRAKIDKSEKVIPVHFNPSTLQYSVESKLDDKKKPGAKQVIKESAAKLAMELVFDTTETGSNVCDETEKVARLLGEADAKKKNSPPEVTFSWGMFAFTGIVDSYKENIEYFSLDGIPLRSIVSISMIRHTDVFNRKPSPPPDKNAKEVPNAPGTTATATATKAGDPNAARQIGADNGQENLRFPNGETTVVEAPSKLAPPAGAALNNDPANAAALSAAPAGAAGSAANVGGAMNPSATLGPALPGAPAPTNLPTPGAGGGTPRNSMPGSFATSMSNISSAMSRASTVVSAGQSVASTMAMGQTQSRQASTFGGRFSAGVSAAQGAFSGIRTILPSDYNTGYVDPARVLDSVQALTTRVDDDAVFDISGRVIAAGSSLGTTVRRIRFDEE